MTHPYPPSDAHSAACGANSPPTKTSVLTPTGHTGQGRRPIPRTAANATSTSGPADSAAPNTSDSVPNR